jgi:protein gp37
MATLNKQKNDGKKGIGWCDYTWNPITGCTNLCCPIRKSCWAKKTAEFRPATHGDPDFSKIIFHEDRLDAPSKEKKPCRIAVGLMGDMWSDGVPNEYLNRFFGSIEGLDRHDFLFLTKNPQRYIDYYNYIEELDCLFPKDLIKPNCWLGFTDINNIIPIQTAIELYKTWNDSNILFVSYEPFIVWMPEIIELVDWVIIGGWSGKKLKPTQDMLDCIEYCQKIDKPIFVKYNVDMRNRPEQFPERKFNYE